MSFHGGSLECGYSEADSPFTLDALTQEEVHHLRRVMRGGGNPQELLPTRHCWVVNGLHVDVMPGHQLITDFCVLSSIGNL